MSTFSDSLDFGDSIPIADSTGPFVDDVSAGYDSQQTDLDVESPIFINGNDNNSSFNAGDTSQPSIYGDYASGRSDGPNLLPASEMMSEEAFALKEWRRENAIRLEEKEKMEKEILNQINEEAEEYKVEFYRKRVITCENKKATNREREEIFVANQKKFHEEANKNYWKSIAELIPNEVPSLERRKGKKDQQENKPSVTVLQGPKAGKPTDLLRMRQILLKLKRNAPAHLKPSPAPVEAEDAKTVATSAEVEVAA